MSQSFIEILYHYYFNFVVFLLYIIQFKLICYFQQFSPLNLEILLFFTKIMIFLSLIFIQFLSFFYIFLSVFFKCYQEYFFPNLLVFFWTEKKAINIVKVVKNVIFPNFFYLFAIYIKSYINPKNFEKTGLSIKNYGLLSVPPQKPSN